MLLLNPVSSQEVKEAIFSIKDSKSPGPNGYGSGFFKKAWPVVGEEITKAVQEFFDKGLILKQINATLMSLIPKKDDANKESDFRPIACCNVVYKAISKVISNRLRMVLPSIITTNQSAFVKGGSIMENILICQDLLKHYIRKNFCQRCLLKIDHRKAYDPVNWDLVEEILHGLNFPPKFINWIMLCIRITSFSINFNGNVHQRRKGHKTR